MDLPIRPGRVVPGEALSTKTSRASGPGGQHVNKTETRVSLALDLDAGLAEWPEPERARVRHKLERRLTADGRLVVHCDSYRSQNRNLEEARRRMAALLLDALHVPKTRRKTQPSKGAQRRRVEAKKRRGETKRLRRKPSFD